MDSLGISDKHLRAIAPRRLTIHGSARIAYKADAAGVTRLADLYQHDPLRVLFPLHRADDLPTAVLVTTSGGLVGGDRLDIGIAAGAGARLLVTTQAAEKVYRSAGPDCRIETRISVGAGGWLDWLPQETILFDGARLRRETRIELDPESRLLAGEMLVFGRIARGERFTRGLARDAWEIRRGGRLVWADALHLDGAVAEILDHPAGFDGAAACATLVYAGPDARALLEPARALLHDDGVRVGVTCIDGLLVLRFLGRDAQRLRLAYGRFRAAFRAVSFGLPDRLPRIWHV